MKVELISWTNDPIGTAAKAASVCYNSDPDRRIIKQCLDSSHHSVVEHMNFTFKIEGCSRILSHQLVRHRIASYSQRSQRYCSEDGAGMVTPPSIEKNFAAEQIYNEALDSIQKVYKELQKYVPNEDARFILPNACETTIYMTMNLRTLMHFMNERLCCFDEKTEVLTKNGWKRFKDCDITDDFYSLNLKTNEVEFSKAVNFINYPVDEELIHLQGQSVDHFCTYDHNMIVSRSYAKNGYKKWEVMSAEQASKTNHLSVKKNCLPIKGEKREFFIIPKTTTHQHNQFTEWEKTYEEKQIPMREFLQFLGFYISDGHCTKSNGHYNICLSKGNREIIETYKTICEKITNNSVKMIQDKSNCWKLIFHDIGLFNYLNKLGKAKEKFIPPFVWDLDYSLLTFLFQGFKDGDMKKDYSCYSTISPQLANDFQRLLLHLGYSGTISCIDRVGSCGGTVVRRNGEERKIIHRNPEYRVSINYTKNEPLMITSTRNNFHKEHYTGIVYCVELEKNHTLYVRRNGKACWSGNCRAQWEIQKMARLMKEAIKEKQFEMHLDDLDMELILSNLVPKCEAGKIKFCPEHKSCGRHITAKEINTILAKNIESKWIDDGGCLICSNCKTAYSMPFTGSNYCPNCGQKIIGSYQEVASPFEIRIPIDNLKLTKEENNENSNN